MARIIREVAGHPGMPERLPILVSDRMAIIEPAFSYLLEVATIPGRSRAAETVRPSCFMGPRVQGLRIWIPRGNCVAPGSPGMRRLRAGSPARRDAAPWSRVAAPLGSDWPPASDSR